MKSQDCRTTDLKKKENKSATHLAPQGYSAPADEEREEVKTAAWKGLDLYDTLTPKVASGMRKTLPESPPPPTSQQCTASVQRTTAPSSGSVCTKVRPSDGLTVEPIQVGAPPASLRR
ncbi:hypothetical protein J1605_001893 [Eschrichtius robustus]|uniref:Uncharacterized protein n=1 Tax=Eschrichtius robustus TaxID=9764 RepID=A0AB34I103_ESCRO|nr:hypothetical protein J1605_001893 [Eschrichtius robustus]